MDDTASIIRKKIRTFEEMKPRAVFQLALRENETTAEIVKIRELREKGKPYVIRTQNAFSIYETERNS